MHLSYLEVKYSIFFFWGVPPNSLSPSVLLWELKTCPLNSPFFPPEQHFPFYCPPTGDTCWGPCSDFPAFPELCTLETKTFSFSLFMGSLCSSSPKIWSPTSSPYLLEGWMFLVTQRKGQTGITHTLNRAEPCHSNSQWGVVLWDGWRAGSSNVNFFFLEYTAVFEAWDFINRIPLRIPCPFNLSLKLLSWEYLM